MRSGPSSPSSARRLPMHLRTWSRNRGFGNHTDAIHLTKGAIEILLLPRELKARFLDLQDFRPSSTSISFRAYVPLAQRSFADEQPRCSLDDLAISGKLLQQDRRLWPIHRPNVEALVNDQPGANRSSSDRR